MGTKRNNKIIQTKKKICDEVWNEQLYLKFRSLIDVRNSDVKTKVDLVACRIYWINKTPCEITNENVFFVINLRTVHPYSQWHYSRFWIAIFLLQDSFWRVWWFFAQKNNACTFWLNQIGHENIPLPFSH